MGETTGQSPFRWAVGVIIALIAAGSGIAAWSSFLGCPTRPAVSSADPSTDQPPRGVVESGLRPPTPQRDVKILWRDLSLNGTISETDANCNSLYYATVELVITPDGFASSSISTRDPVYLTAGLTSINNSRQIPLAAGWALLTFKLNVITTGDSLEIYEDSSMTSPVTLNNTALSEGLSHEYTGYFSFVRQDRCPKLEFHGRVRMAVSVVDHLVKDTQLGRSGEDLSSSSSMSLHPDTLEAYYETLDRLRDRFLEMREFQQRMAGTRVDWTGVVEDVSEASEDGDLVLRLAPSETHNSVSAMIRFSRRWRTKLFSLHSFDRARVTGTLIEADITPRVLGDTVELVNP